MAIYVTKNSDSYIAKCVSSVLVEDFTQSGVFMTVERTSDFLSGLQREQSYQYSGNVDDNQLSRLGRQFGVNLICVIDIAFVSNHAYTTVRIIEAETGLIIATAEGQNRTGSNPCDCSWSDGSRDPFTKNNIAMITKKLIQQLIQQLPCIKKDQKITSEYSKCCEGLVNVDGICKDPNICITKDQKITSNLLKCCERLTNVDGVCRDHIWVKNYLGIEANANDLEVRQGSIFDGKCKTCPDGWRLPTKKNANIKRSVEFQREWNILDIRFHNRNYI